MLLLFNSRTLLKDKQDQTVRQFNAQQRLSGVNLRDPPLSLCLVFYALVLADGFAVFHGHLGLVGAHFFALPASVEHKVT